MRLYFFVAIILVSYCYISHSEICTLTGLEPSMPKSSLGFCTMFMDRSCCDPGQVINKLSKIFCLIILSLLKDAQIESFYNALIGVSDLCQSIWTKSQMSLYYFYCYGCNPSEPKYSSVDNVVNICPAFARDIDPGHFDECGLSVTSGRGDQCALTNVVTVLLFQSAYTFFTLYFLFHR